MRQNQSSITLIDDDMLFHRIMTGLCRRLIPPIQVSHFYNGQEALEGLDQLRRSGEALPEILLLDLNMPFMDGWQFLHALQSSPSWADTNWKIYICSSSIDPADTVRAASHPLVSGYLTKPVSLSALQKLMG